MILKNHVISNFNNNVLEDSFHQDTSKYYVLTVLGNLVTQYARFLGQP